MLALRYETTRYDFNARCHNCDFNYHRKVVLGITGELLERQACKERSTPLFPVLRTTLPGLPLLCSAPCSAPSPRSALSSAHLLGDAAHPHPLEINGMLTWTWSQPLSRCASPGNGESVKQMQGRDLSLSFQLLFRIPTPPP